MFISLHNVEIILISFGVYYSSILLEEPGTMKFFLGSAIVCTFFDDI